MLTDDQPLHRGPMLDQNQTISPAEQPRSTLHVSWLQPAGLIALSFVNSFLRLITLGIYSFWGKTEVRKRIWSAIRIEGEPLQYTGTGKELFLGFLIIFGVVMLPISLSSFGVLMVFGHNSPAYTIYTLLLYVFIFLLIGIGTYRAQRYRLSRTMWRGIRGGLVGSDVSYAWTYFWSAFLVPMTMGWITPWRTTELQKIITRDMRFGDRPFTFTAKPGPLYKSFAVLWFSGLLIFIIAVSVVGLNIDTSIFKPENAGANKADPRDAAKFIAILYGVMAVAFLFYYIISAWYRSKAINHFAANTHYEGATFNSTVTGLGLVRVAIGNFFINMAGWTLVFALLALVMIPVMMLNPGFDATTAASNEGLRFALTSLGVLFIIAASGLFTPITQTRNARYLVQNLSIDGTVPLGDIAQGELQRLSRGEGLAQAFDIDGF
jgi:uncharacterized membrane protein YjgN (DUF898 family)